MFDDGDDEDDAEMPLCMLICLAVFVWVCPYILGKIPKSPKGGASGDDWRKTAIDSESVTRWGQAEVEPTDR
jgi:hypothetical protein